ncbi:hypothetical protein [Hyphobacterium sp.]|jgi:spore coat polysaccharide biosynthesis predicted glycosyltransferase SpsG|uniref:hypothetical protein n=1 Tax=Hyphobacterium sp. TaxID=2004662 RepID=UPI003BAAAE36
MIWLRCRLGPDIGWGHAMRCWSLAQAMTAEGIEAGFILDDDAGDFRRRVSEGGFAHRTIPRNLSPQAEASAYPPGPVVLDLSNAQCRTGLPALVAALKASGRKIAVIEGLGPDAFGGPVPPDLLVTPYLGATADQSYQIPHLVGAAYAVLAPEYGAPPTPLETRDRLLVMMSGSDPWQLTEIALAALGPFGPRLLVAIGGGIAEARAAAIETGVVQLGGEAVSAPSSLHPLFMRSRVALIGPGLVKYEAVATQTPAVILSPGEEFDAAQSAFVEAGLAERLTVGQPDLTLALQRAVQNALEQIPEAPPPIDGRGAHRLALALRTHLGE